MSLEDIYLDPFGNFELTANGDVRTVKDQKCLRQDVGHRLMTPTGDLWLHLLYGAGLQRHIQNDNTDMNRLELIQDIRLGIKQDELVDPESIEVTINSWERNSISILASYLPSEEVISGIDEAERADIVITITQDGISIQGGESS